MGNPAGVRRDFEALERRRMKAAELLRQGVSQREVARRLGVHRQSVIRWARRLAHSGEAGLKKAGRAGRKPRLSGAQLKQIEHALKRGPEALGYATGLWTASRVSGLSERPHRVRTWAPRGQTPVLQYHFNWKVLSAAAGITWWNFYFRLYQRT